jgi:hypothetical protein
LSGTGIATLLINMINTKILDWIEGYVITRMLVFGDFIGTVYRSDFLVDLDTTSEYFRRFEGQRIQALSLPVKSIKLSTLLGKIEACFQRGWDLLDAGEWTEDDFNEVYELSQQISAEIWQIRRDIDQLSQTNKVEESLSHEID